MATDVVSVSVAARQLGMTSQGLSYWVEQDWVASHGRGPRRAVLVSLAEVSEMAEWRARSIGLAEAVRILNSSQGAVWDLCLSGALPYRQPSGAGGGCLIDRAAVEALAQERLSARQGLLTMAEAAELTGWPHWVLKRFADEGQLRVQPGRQGARLINQGELEAFVAAREASQEPCPVCTEPLPPGRAVHKGSCAGLAASAARHSPGVQQKINKECRAKLKATKAAGLLQVRELAKIVDRSERIVWRWVWRLDLGTIVAAESGGARRLLSQDEIAEIQARIESSQLADFHSDPKLRGDWYYARHKSLTMYRRKSAELAAMKGNTVGREALKNEAMTDEKRDRIKKLRARPQHPRDSPHNVRVKGLRRKCPKKVS